MYPHRIRLRGPWECEPLARTICSADGSVASTTEGLPPASRITIPCRWRDGGLGDFRGRVRFRRNFGFPSKIDPHERLWLTFEGVDTVAEIAVNDQPLGRHEGAGEPFEFEVTSLLKDRNVLQVDVESATSSGGIYGDVTLEVRCPAFLRRIRIWYEGEGHTVDLHASGDVVGSSDSPLEVCLLLDARTVARDRAEATASGRPFHLTGERLKVKRSSGDSMETTQLYKARVDLVCGTMIWYAAEDVVAFTPGRSAAETDTAHEKS